MKSGLVELSPPTPGRIGEVRAIRNSWVGRGILRNDRRVTPQEHRSWYAGLDAEKDRVFLVTRKTGGEVLGYVTCCGGGFPAGTAEIGIFIKETCSLLLVPYHANILLVRHAFEEMGLMRLIACFRAENTKAIRFNTSLGFEVTAHTRREVMTELVYDRYREYLPKYRRLMGRGNAPHPPPSLSFGVRTLRDWRVRPTDGSAC